MDRQEFREAVLERDGHTCVLCGKPAVDAHHILERRLWSDGGYVLDNGASLCAACHIAAEQTVVSVEQIREAARVAPVVPDHLFADGRYDKWGNLILEDGNRLPGPLYEDTSVQKALRSGGVANLFLTHWKYPRTLHLPWSGGASVKDEKTLSDLSGLQDSEIVVTEKMDGENTTMYSDFIHARSVSSDSRHGSRSWVKNLHASICADIPVGYRIVGENMFAAHSIRYDDLVSYFLVFSMWHRNVCLAWDEIKEWCELLGLVTVRELYRGPYNEKLLLKLADELDAERSEGYVVRSTNAFFAKDFHLRVAKYQRENHVTSDSHWMYGKIEQNKLA